VGRERLWRERDRHERSSGSVSIGNGRVQQFIQVGSAWFAAQ